MLVVLSNLPPIQTITGLNFDYHRFSNKNGSYTFCEIPFKGRTYSRYRVLEDPYFWLEYEFYHPKSGDTILYRLFARNPLKFWHWAEYIYDWRFELPYKDWDEIKKKRGYELKNANNWQDF